MAYGKKLTDEEIAKRLTRLRNLEQLHAHDRLQIATLKAENAQLRADMAALADRFEALFQKQQIRIAELEKMVFGTRQHAIPPHELNGSAGSGSPGDSAKTVRSRASFRRATPPDTAVTATTIHSVASCYSCGNPLFRIRTHIRYVEDIVLPVADGSKTKTVTKQYIQSGWCGVCRQTTYGDGIDLRGQQVVLGDNVRLLTTYCMTILDMTYAQIVTVLRDLYGFVVSEGEVAAIAAKQGRALLPEHETIAQGIREGPGLHLDETGFTIQSQNMGWAWCMAGTATEDVIYYLAESRGKGHVKELLGTYATSVHIHDCYGAYRHLDAMSPGQTCWSHYYRVVRDLACLDEQTLGGGATKAHCVAAKDELGSIYADLRTYLSEPFDQQTRRQQQIALQARIDWFCVPHPDDPKKLQDLKQRLQDWRHTLLTCLTHEGIPADNNKAERHLRKLVLKRKKSFGVQNLKTARTLSTLMSVAWTYKHRTQAAPGALLPALAQLVRG